MKNKAILIFFTYFAILSLGCGPSVKDEFPKFDTEYQKILQSKEYIEFKINYDYVCLKWGANQGHEGVKTLLKTNDRIIPALSTIMVTGGEISYKFITLGLSVKNKEIREFCINLGALYSEAAGCFAGIIDNQKSNPEKIPDIIDKMFKETSSKFNGVEGNYMKLKFS